MEMPKKEISKWINALRSGKYKQENGRLQTSKGFCCLGVACKEFIEVDKLLLDKKLLLVGETPYVQDAPDWLRGVSIDFKKKSGITLVDLNDGIDPIGATITNMNIDTKFTFDEIADLLQAVYIEEVLK